MRVKRAITVARVCIFLSLGAVHGCSKEESFDARSEYKFAEWVGKTVTNYTGLVTNWIPPFSACGITNALRNDRGPTANAVAVTRYWVANDPSMTSVTIIESTSVAGAHNALMDDFDSMTLHPLSLCTTNGAVFGDRCYERTGPVGNRTFAFVRNNVCVIVGAIEKGGVSVKGLAETLDADLLRLSVRR